MATTMVSLREDLDRRQEAGRHFNLEEAVATLVPLITDVAQRHQAGESLFLYPACIELSPSGARLDAASATAMATSNSCRACLAPEIRGGTPGGACASVFAVGGMLYEMLTGEVVGPTMRRPSDVMPKLPKELDVLVAKALVADPKHRPADLNALGQALHNMAPTASVPPPLADEVNLDRTGEFEVDVSLSLLPPSAEEFERMKREGRISSPSLISVSVGEPVSATPSDMGMGASGTTRTAERLAELKAALESDPRPRYIVVRDGMDHGPFSGVEMLQQIASGNFTSDHIVRDSLSLTTNRIDDWDEFAPFAVQAELMRKGQTEREALEAGVAADQQRTHVKAFAVGGILLLILAAGAGWWAQTRRRTAQQAAVDADRAQSIDVDGGFKESKKRGGGRWKGGGAGKRSPSSGSIPTIAGGGSCEAARARYVEEYKMQGDDTPPDLTAGAYGAVLNRGTYLNACGVPPTMGVTICAAVQNGRAVGVTVRTKPANGGIARCISGQIRSMSFPAHPRLDVTTTSFKGE